MKLKYKVFSSHLGSYPAKLKLADGSEVEAMVPLQKAQLVPVDQSPEAGTITLAVPQSADAAAMLVEGREVSITVESA